MKYGKDIIGIGVWGIIINSKQEILLIKKINRDYWEAIGGKVEFGERLEDALIRETLEETGIDIEIIDMLIFDEIFRKLNEHWLTFTYLSRHISGIPEILEPHKHEDLQWFSIENIPNNLSPALAKGLELYKKIFNKDI